MNAGARHDLRPVPGLEPLRLGDILQCFSAQWIIYRLSDCCANGLPLTGKLRTVNPRFGEPKSFIEKGKPQTFARQVDRDAILERRGQAGLDDFLASKKAPAHREGTMQESAAGADNENNQTTEGDSNMPKTKGTTKRKPRGGLAAEAAELKDKGAKTQEPTSKGVLGEYKGHSITSVLRALGKAGVNTAHAKAINKAAKLNANEATVVIQVNHGRNGKGEPAALSKDELAELIASAPDPKAEAAAAK